MTDPIQSTEATPALVRTHFKDWAKPGRVPPGDSSGVRAGDGESLDALSGHFRLLQLRDGHRFSTDDLLAAWYGTQCCPSAGSVLDLGSGIGTVGMIAAWRLQGARFVTVEAQSQSVALARRSACYNGIESRYEIREGDFRHPDVLKPDERFDLILGSPPYFPPGSGVLGDHPQKIACRFELRGDVRDYCATAGRHLASGGCVALVFPWAEDQRGRLMEGANASGLCILRQRSVVFRDGEPPLVGVFCLMRANDLPAPFRATPLEEPPLIIRRRDGAIDPEYSRIKMTIGFPP